MRMRYFVAGSLLIVGIVAIVQAQPGGGRGFGGGPQFLIGQKAVQEDLKVTEQQAEKLKDVTKDFGFGGTRVAEIYKDAGIEFGKGGGFGKGMSDEDREKFVKAQAKVRDEAYKVLGDILNKDQIERLKQIERQQLGIRAFSDAEVESALKLTDSQKTSVKGITGDYDKERREITADATKDTKKGKFGGFGAVDPETQKKINKVQKEAIGKVTDLLDDSQKAKWKELVGAEFDLSKLQTGFGGFGKDKKKKD